MEYKERNPGTGVLYTNRKKKSAAHPDWVGELKVSRDYVAGETLKISAWTKDTTGGVLISLKEDNWQPPVGGNNNPTPSKRKDDDEIPF
jgi:hypothetical protein